jgi:ABC-type branched-subunit amino acid transport system substrate-binding protein
VQEIDTLKGVHMMGKKAKLLTLVLAAALLVGVPGLVGCGGGDGGGNEIVIGILTDFTGTAASAVKPTMDGIRDYFAMMEETDPTPGAKVKFITYDTRLDYARVIPGWTQLKDRGAVMMVVINPGDRDKLATRVGNDKIPVIGVQETTTNPGAEWMFNLVSPIEYNVETLMEWIVNEKWDYDTEKRNPKIGHLSWPMDTGTFHQGGIDNALAEYPDKLEFVGKAVAPIPTTQWSSEINALQDSDFILLSPVGTMMASFISEARQKGYDGAFLSGINSFPGYWDLAKTMTSNQSDLRDCYYAGPWPWWNEDVDFITGLKADVQERRPEAAATLLTVSGPIGGGGMGVFMYDAVKRAVEEEGVENVDGTALRDALAETSLDVEGFGNVWEFKTGQHFLCRTSRIFEWNVTEQEWKVASSDPEWITPISLQ